MTTSITYYYGSVPSKGHPTVYFGRVIRTNHTTGHEAILWTSVRTYRDRGEAADAAEAEAKRIGVDATFMERL